MQDYLQAPMPFLIGLPAQLLPAVRQMALSEVLVLDLDLGKLQPQPGISPADDSAALPWSDRLLTALQVHSYLLRLPCPAPSEANCMVP